jgi:hypothetical protein
VEDGRKLELFPLGWFYREWRRWRWWQRFGEEEKQLGFCSVSWRLKEKEAGGKHRRDVRRSCGDALVRTMRKTTNRTPPRRWNWALCLLLSWTSTWVGPKKKEAAVLVC